MADPAAVSFSSTEGRALVLELLRSFLPYEPHDYQLKGVCEALDGVDLLATIATGAGKTGYYIMYILVVLALQADAKLAARFSRRFPLNPAMVIVYPTNGLEEEMAKTFTKMGIRAVAINSHTLQKARHNLWRDAETLANVILLSPEQLISKSCEVLVQSKSFLLRVCLLGVDEVHLINSWGEGFRKSFTQIGFVRARISASRSTSIIATTATLMMGRPFSNVCTTLGFTTGSFYHLRRSNHRPELRLIFRVLHRGLGGWLFPDLAWVLGGTRRTVIFCRTIALSFRVTLYLRRLAPPSPPHNTRIRMYNALNWPSYNADTLSLFRSDPHAQIIVATTSFMVGLDFPDIRDTILLGHPPGVDDLLQWAGRTGRDRDLVQDGRCITYLTPKASETAEAILSGNSAGKKKRSSNSSTAVETKMDEGMAAMILAPCKIAKQNELYDNPEDTPCQCKGCRVRPIAARPQPCNCSGCMDDDEPALPVIPSAPPVQNPVKQHQRLSKPMRAHGTLRLVGFRWLVYQECETRAGLLLPPTAFFPDAALKLILDRFALLQTHEDLRTLMSPYPYVQHHLDALWTLVEKLRRKFKRMAKTHAEQLKAKRAQKMQEDNLQASASVAQASSHDAAPEPSQPSISGDMGVRRSRRLRTAETSTQLSVPAHMATVLDVQPPQRPRSASKRRAVETATIADTQTKRVRRKLNANKENAS